MTSKAEHAEITSGHRISIFTARSLVKEIGSAEFTKAEEENLFSGHFASPGNRACVAHPNRETTKSKQNNHAIRRLVYIC